MTRDAKSGHQERAKRTMEYTKKAIEAALHRLLNGKPTHPKHVGRVIRIGVASVCREARVSRQPLYNMHPDLLEKIRSHSKKVRSSNTATERRRASDRLRVEALERDLSKALSQNLTLIARLSELSSGKLSNMTIGSNRARDLKTI